MGLTNFPNGVTSFGVPVLGDGNLVPFSTGTFYFVDSVNGNDSNSGKEPGKALATLQAAVNLTTTNKADVIVLMPGHAETLVAAGSLTINKSGLTIVGLGVGTNRPTITMATATTATILATSGNCTFRNFRVTTSVDELVKIFDIQAAGVNVDTVDYFETATKQALAFLVTTAAGTDLTVQNCTHTQITAAAGNGYWITLVGADRARVMNNNLQITTTDSASSTIIGSLTTAPKNIYVANNLLVNAGAVTNSTTLSFLAATTGHALYNTSFTNRTTLAGTHALGTTMAGAQNLATHTANKSGILDPVADV